MSAKATWAQIVIDYKTCRLQGHRPPDHKGRCTRCWQRIAKPTNQPKEK